MSRQHYVILFMGVASMIVLSTLMKYFLQVRQDKRPPVVAELNATYGSYFEREPKLATRRLEKGSEQAVLTIYPRIGSSRRRLARQVGEFLWRRSGPAVKAVQVVAVDWSSGDKHAFDIERPYRSRAPRRRATPAAPGGAGSTSPAGSAAGGARPPAEQPAGRSPAAKSAPRK